MVLGPIIFKMPVISTKKWNYSLFTKYKYNKDKNKWISKWNINYTIKSVIFCKKSIQSNIRGRKESNK